MGQTRPTHEFTGGVARSSCQCQQGRGDTDWETGVCICDHIYIRLCLACVFLCCLSCESECVNESTRKCLMFSFLGELRLLVTIEGTIYLR